MSGTYVNRGGAGEDGYYDLKLHLCVSADEVEAFARLLDETGLLGGGDVLREELADLS